MPEKRKRGRPAASRQVRVTPEFREQLDVEKLGRTLLAIAMEHAKEEELPREADPAGCPSGNHAPVSGRKGDAMT